MVEGILSLQRHKLGDPRIPSSSVFVCLVYCVALGINRSRLQSDSGIIAVRHQRLLPSPEGTFSKPRTAEQLGERRSDEQIPTQIPLQATRSSRNPLTNPGSGISPRGGSRAPGRAERAAQALGRRRGAHPGSHGAQTVCMSQCDHQAGPWYWLLHLPCPSRQPRHQLGALNLLGAGSWKSCPSKEGNSQPLFFGEIPHQPRGSSFSLFFLSFLIFFFPFGLNSWLILQLWQTGILSQVSAFPWQARGHGSRAELTPGSGRDGERREEGGFWLLGLQKMLGCSGGSQVG